MFLPRPTTTTLAVLLAAAGGYLLGAHHHTAATRRWRYAALHDPLTGLPNRRAVYEHLMPDHPDGCVAILDLDHLKAVNTDHGLHAGDQLITAAAASMRIWAQANDTRVARLGGDEFLVVLPDTTTLDRAADQIGELLDWLSQPIQLATATHRMSATAGISDRTGSDEQDRARAGLALRTAKLHRGSALTYDATRDGIPAPDGTRPALRSRDMPNAAREVHTDRNWQGRFRAR